MAVAELPPSTVAGYIEPRTSGATIPYDGTQRLRADLNTALNRAAREAGVPILEFTEPEKWLVAAAVDLADWSEKLRARRDAERAGEARPSVLVKYSAEVRHCERQLADTLARLDFNVGKSPQHQRAARARWDARPGRPGAARAMRGA